MLNLIYVEPFQQPDSISAIAVLVFFDGHPSLSFSLSFARSLSLSFSAIFADDSFHGLFEDFEWNARKFCNVITATITMVTANKYVDTIECKRVIFRFFESTLMDLLVGSVDIRSIY